MTTYIVSKTKTRRHLLSYLNSRRKTISISCDMRRLARKIPASNENVHEIYFAVMRLLIKSRGELVGVNFLSVMEKIVDAVYRELLKSMLRERKARNRVLLLRQSDPDLRAVQNCYAFSIDRTNRWKSFFEQTSLFLNRLNESRIFIVKP